MSRNAIWLPLNAASLFILSVIVFVASKANAQLAIISGSLSDGVVVNVQGNYLAPVTITNSGSATIPAITISAPGTTLGSGMLTSIPAPIINLAPGASATVNLSFPFNSISSSGELTVLRVSGSYTLANSPSGGTWALAFRTIVIKNGKNAYYVDPVNGSDSNDGISPSTAWLTICHADSALGLGPNGTMVHLLPGIYNLAKQGSCYTGTFIVTMQSGTPGQRVEWLSDVQYGAKLRNGWWQVQGSYNDVVGIEISNPRGGAAVYFGFNSNLSAQSMGNFDSLRNSYIHDVGTTCTVTQNSGAVGMYNVSHDVVFDSNVIDKVGVPGGCNGDWANNFHGIYLQGYRGTVTNNIISNVAAFGVEAYHNSCDQVISNNTLIHNYAGAIQYTGGPDTDDGGCLNSGGNYTTINNNLVIRNGYGCGVANPGTLNTPSAVGIWFYSNPNAGLNEVQNNYLASNWSSTGDPNCTDSSGTNNTIVVTDGSGASCYDGHCPLPDGVKLASQGSNIGSNIYSGIVVAYADDAKSGDFHLVSGSPAIGVGTAGTCAPFPSITPCVPAIDFDGLARSPNSYDIGAYAFNSLMAE